ncbi:MAG: PTS sugar transporter subunit IIC [Gemmatimonadetes bacterium]|jgi:mannose/fructose/N-acetylgalactosamine-specific phosphotransferase system component IIC|nr:PTS sugar transporter subunit IIC [Gemmatimonadota bacterium]
MELLRIGLMGGCLALDATSVGQFMFSRPLVAGALTGWLLGDAVTGLTVGAILEIYMLVSIPSGGASFPDGTTAAVVAVAAATASDTAGSLPLAIGIGLLWGQIGAYSVTELRKLNGHLVPEPTDASAGPRRIVFAQVSGVGLDFLRGAAITVLGAVTGRALVSRLAPSWPLSIDGSYGLLFVGAAVSVGILLHDLGGFRRRKILFALGLALGVVGARFL